MAGDQPIVDCPRCKGPSSFASRNRWRPFCSERCKDFDLGAWANEEFRLASKALEEEDETSAPAPENLH